MSLIRLLVVENDPDDMQIYQDAVEDFNSENELTIEIIESIEKEDALDKITNHYFDAAIIDLNLSPSGNNDEGKELVLAIKENARYPIYIVSAQLYLVEDEFNDNLYIEKIIKDADLDSQSILEKIKNTYSIGLTKILNSKGIIEKHFNNIFWNHLAKSKHYWDNHQQLTGEELEKVISRYTLSHLQEYFQIEHSTGNEIDSYDPSEMYIKPPINKSLKPGSIVFYEGSKHLVLTPSCTISQDNCDCLTLLKLNALLEIEEVVALKEELNTFKSTVDPLIQSNVENIEKFLDHDIDQAIYINLKENNTPDKFCEYYQSVKTELNKLPCKKVVSRLEENSKQILSFRKAYTKKENAITTLIKTYVKNNVSDRFYFLAEFLDFRAKVIDFQDIKTVDISQGHNLDPIMDITTPFLKDIQEKFSSYYARQGAPDFDSDSISIQYTRKLIDS